MKLKEAELFDKIYPQLVTSHDEVALLSKKSPDGAMNKFKLTLVNQMLAQANFILGTGKPFESFENFIEDEMNTNSDVTFILAQYTEALWKVKKENVKMASGNWYWVLSDSQKEIETSRYK